MSIQITNDPINQFLDNLPRYALEMRRQDAQLEQFDRQQNLREQAFKSADEQFNRQQNLREQAFRSAEIRYDKADKLAESREARLASQDARQKRLLDLTFNTNQYVSSMFKERINTDARMRIAEKKARNFEKDHESLLNDYENRSMIGRIPVKLGLMSGSFPDYLKFQRSITPPALRGPYDSALADFKNLKENYNPIDIKPKDIPIPKNVLVNQSLYDMTTNYSELQQNKKVLLNDLYDIFNDDSFKTNNDFMINLQRQQAEAER